ncbi:Reverse transcriptase [Theobroma cacao]|nr:Reverse transcriptase [Theobroma cacao]
MAFGSFNAMASLVFNGENYLIWVVKMKAYLREFDLWIMACENTKDVWDKLQEEPHGSHRNREMQALNLLRELKVLKMKDNESIKEYSDKVMKVVNQLRLLWENLHEKRNMNKVLIRTCELQVPVTNGIWYKFDVFNQFVKYVASMEDETGKKIMNLRIDNGSIEFKDFLALKGIKHQLIGPCTPQQNGVCELKNRTIVKMTHCLLFEKSLPKSFWIEAVNVSVYLLNLLPTRTLEAKSPYEVWHVNKLKSRLVAKGYSQVQGVDFMETFVSIVSENEAILYIKLPNGKVQLIVSLYVNDLLIPGLDNDFLKEFKAQMKAEFEMTDLGEMSYFLGIEFKQMDDQIVIHQSKYAKDLLKKFNMSFCKPTPTLFAAGCKLDKDDGEIKTNATIYKSMIGCLLYLSTSKLNIMYATGLLS